MPTIANEAASSRRLRTTNRSARTPVMGRDPIGGTGAAAHHGRPVGPPRIRRVIDREQVLHVARLARLELSADEVERMARELSTILEHVERIGRLDLDGVEPTSHVVSLENVFRADEPRPSWPRERVLEGAPDPAEGAFRVPSPQA
jgi:aspartyl-tRNA(Asn)/glutamyl-tRNA(Gln) amidotransferase subunit C